MDKSKPEYSKQNSSISADSKLLPCKNLSLTKKQSSLVPYYNDSSDSADEMRTSDVGELRKKNLTSPRKRKKNINRCISYKLFPESNDEHFNGCFPTTSDGSIDIDRLFNPHDQSWTGKLSKALNQFPCISDIKTQILE